MLFFGGTTGPELAVITTFILSVGWAAFRRPRWFPLTARLIHFRQTKLSAPLIGGAILASVFSSTLGYWAAWITTQINPESAAEDYNFAVDHLFSNGWLMLSGTFNTPIVEEFLFRGFFLFWLRKKMSLGKAIVVSSLLFGILHLEIFGATLFGMVMCVALLKSGSLFLPIALHFLNNALVFLYVWLVPVSDEVATTANVMELNYSEQGMWIACALLIVSSPGLIWLARSWQQVKTLGPHRQTL